MLKGKGVEVKGLVAPLLMVWRSFMNSGDEEHRLIAFALQSVHSIQCIVNDYNHDRFLPQDQASTIQVDAHYFLKAYTIIGNFVEAQ